MVDRIPQFEVEDTLGTTTPFSGTVGTSLIAVPAAPGTKIQSFIVISDRNNVAGSKIQVYLDGGTVISAELNPGGYFSGPVKNLPTQIHIKANQAGVGYKVTLNREQA